MAAKKAKLVMATPKMENVLKDLVDGNLTTPVSIANHQNQKKKQNLNSPYVEETENVSYTGGFRLVDMSETVKEKDEEGNEIEKVIPKLGVLGIDKTEDNEMGTLYFNDGNVFKSVRGQQFTFEVEQYDKNVVLYVYAYRGSSVGVRTTKKTNELSNINTLYGYPNIVRIGSYKLTENGIEDIQQFFYGTEVVFPLREPVLAKVTLGEHGTGAYPATLYYRPPGTFDTSSEDISQTSGHVYLSEGFVGGRESVGETAWVTVYPTTVRVLDAEVSDEQ